MATITGTASQVDGSGGNGSTSVTVPADATAAIAFWAHYDGSTGTTLSSLTLGGNSFTTAIELSEGHISQHSGTGVATLTNLPGTGTQTLAWTWSAGGARSEGGGIFIVWVKAVDLASLVRDSKADSFLGTSLSMSSPTITTDTTDLLIALIQSFTGTNPTHDLASSLINDVTINQEVYDIGYETPSGTTRTVTYGGDYATIVLISLRNTSGGTAYTDSATVTLTLTPSGIEAQEISNYAIQPPIFIGG